MPVSLPTAADVRRAREQAARNGADVARTPLLAVLGAGEYAVATVSRAVTEADARARAVQHRVADLPQRLRPTRLRRVVTHTYGDLAERGEQAWDRLRRQPPLDQVISTIESYSEKLDARVDVLVDDAHDAAEKALTVISRQTRTTGEKAARTTRRVAADAAGAVVEVTQDLSDAVAEAGLEVAVDIAGAGDEVARDTRTATAEAAARTAPVVTPTAVPIVPPAVVPAAVPTATPATSTAPTAAATRPVRKPTGRRGTSGTNGTSTGR